MSSNPFKDMTSVEVYPKEFDGMSLETVSDTVEVTLRVPEQFFTETYNRADWEAAVAGTEGMAVGDLTEIFRDSIDVEQEVYGPDGNQVPLW